VYAYVRKWINTGLKVTETIKKGEENEEVSNRITGNCIVERFDFCWVSCANTCANTCANSGTNSGT